MPRTIGLTTWLVLAATGSLFAQATATINGRIVDQAGVTVSGQVPLVETTQSVASNSITQTEVQALPMLNRSMSAIMNLLPGAREVPGSISAHGFSSSFVSFGGSTGRNFNMLVDGSDNKEDNCGGTLLVYSLEGVQEFKTLTTGASAEYGRGSATVLVATKSGTNQLHGTGFVYGRNQALIATDYFSDPGHGGYLGGIGAVSTLPNSFQVQFGGRVSF